MSLACFWKRLVKRENWKIPDFSCSAKQFGFQMELLQDFYETTLDALKDAKNDRLWFKTNTKLGKLYFDRSDFNKLAKILKQLHQSCQVRLSNDDPPRNNESHNLFKSSITKSIFYQRTDLLLFIIIIIPDWWWRGRFEKGNPIVRDIRLRNSDVHSSEE